MDIRMTQKILGYNDIDTMLRYLYTSHKDLVGIVSPIKHLKIATLQLLLDKKE